MIETTVIKSTNGSKAQTMPMGKNSLAMGQKGFLLIGLF